MTATIFSVLRSAFSRNAQYCKIQRSASSVSAENKDVIYYLSIVFECCAIIPLAETINEGLMPMLSL